MDESLDFLEIKERHNQNHEIEIYPSFKIIKSDDLIIKGNAFNGIWDEYNKEWSTDEYRVAELIDDKLKNYAETKYGKESKWVKIKWISDYSNPYWDKYKRYVKSISDNGPQLDTNLVFRSQITTKEDHSSKKLPYDLEDAPCPVWDEIVGTLYSPEERKKIEWAIGSIVSGDSKKIQKFFVFYGDPGTGKSTILNIINSLFEGYCITFKASDIVGNNRFGMEQFNKNPLIAIQQDGDLSRIEDNSRLNSLISHETMTVDEKFKTPHPMTFHTTLFLSSNKPVQITDGKSGLIRRLIDIYPSGNLIPIRRYEVLMDRIKFELGAIANHCLNIYREMGKNAYNNYKPIQMMYRTDMFFNFVDENKELFEEQDGTTLAQAYERYKRYKEDANLPFALKKSDFREELKNYFKAYYEGVTRFNDKPSRNVYTGFLKEKFERNRYQIIENPEDKPYSLVLDQTESILDKLYADCPAQYATDADIPEKAWDNVKTVLADIDTTKVHYVRPPENHIVIDFDIKGDDGEKNFEKNLEAASKWPATYAEVSKGGSGIHLHYIYDGDVTKLKSLYSKDIEVKKFPGKAPLRRRLSVCNNVPIAHINSGLPLKEEKMVNFDTIMSEKKLRNLIEKNLRKEIHPGTKPSIDFIAVLLEEAYNSGLKYDVTDLRPKILAFANNSTNKSEYCVKMVNKMLFKSDEDSEGDPRYLSDDLIFYDVEVFPNLFVVVWKVAGEDKKCVKMINPSPVEIEELLRHKLIGFNCRRYDNHIMYARMMGYSNEQLYLLSQRIIEGSKNAFFGGAYNLSYTDVYDFASAGNKMSLKKWEIELGIHHQECPLPWDQPAPEDQWEMVADYCCNDVISTEAVFNHLKGDWTARQILAELSGLSVNDTTNSHTTRIIFGYDQHPQLQFVYTDLTEMFPGYKFENGKSFYKGFEVGEGGFVYAEPGMYGNTALLDIASMHPTSIEQLNLFGPKYTGIFSDIKNARLAIKHNDVEQLSQLLDGKLVKYIDNADFNLKDLSNALKTVINSVYGLTSAKFDNKFRDPRNVDNIVAKRGALFMIDLLEAVKAKGYIVAHIKTDSIKIPDADPEIIQFVMDFGKKYGYNFEHEATYDRMCLVNDAVYIARYRDGDKLGDWTATGTEFAVPYIYKTLFTKEPIEFNDLCVTKSVNTSLYLDMNEDLEDPTEYEKDLKKLLKEDDPDPIRVAELEGIISQCHNYVFVGRIGQFCPILKGCGGGELYSRRDNDKYYSVAGTKGYRFLESEVVKNLGMEDSIDESYFLEMANESIEHISKYGDYEWFVSDTMYSK